MSPAGPALVAGLEAGGTRIACGLGSGPGDLRAELRFATGGPDESLARAIEFFRAAAATHGTPAALGIGCFGPLDLDPGSAGFGRLTRTPKPGWAGVDVAGRLGRALGLPVAIETDVNAAALAEHRWGAARGLDTFVYLTVGTGIGGGGLARGRLLRGLIHPEMGHLAVPHDLARDPFPGCCPFHRDCLEGLASGPALAARWGRPGEALGPDHPAWEIEAGYLAAGLRAIVLVLSPERLVLGGGVMRQARLWPLVRAGLAAQLGGYLCHPALAGGLEGYVVPPGLGERAGLLGAIGLAQDLLAGQPAG